MDRSAAVPTPEEAEITRALRQVAKNDANAYNELFPLVYQQLRQIAQKKRLGEPSELSLQVSDIVHQAYLRLAATRNPIWNDRKHFYRVAALVVQHVLVDHARKYKPAKVELDDAVLPVSEAEAQKYLLLNRALERLDELNPVLAEVVQLRFFVGLTHAEIAVHLGKNEKTAKRYWDAARAWLRREFGLPPDRKDDGSEEED